jgi:hypothetical protein
LQQYCCSFINPTHKTQNLEQTLYLQIPQVQRIQLLDISAFCLTLQIPVLQRPYGIEIDLLEVSAKDKIGLKIFNSWSVASLVKKIGGTALGNISRRQILESSALALITVPILDKI